MNRRSDIDVVLRHWLDDGPAVMPDRVIDVVADRISVQSQRRRWRLLRRLPMNSLLKLGAAAAAVLIVAVVAWNLLPGGGTGPGGGPSPTPPSPTPTLQPSPTPPQFIDGRLTGGRYAIHPYEDSLAVSLVIPAGWRGAPEWAVLGPDTEEPPGGVAVAFLEADGLHSDPCHWDLDGSGAYDQPGDVAVGPSVSDLVEALQASSAYPSTAASPVTVGGFQGSALEIQLPTDLDAMSCDEEANAPGYPRYFVFSGGGAGLYDQGNDSRWRLSIVDVGGRRLVIVLLSFGGTSAADIAAAQSIIDSIEITP